MLKGTYVFKQNGEEIGRRHNVITTNGKKIIAAFMAGKISNWCGSVVVGAGFGTANTSDTALIFETYKTTVQSLTPTYGTASNRITAKFELATTDACRVYEAGIYSSSASSSSDFTARSSLILQAIPNESWSYWTTDRTLEQQVNSTSGFVSPTASTGGLDIRVGGSALLLTSTTGSTATTYRANIPTLDLSSLDSSDLFTFAGATGATANIASVEIRFVTDDSNYFYYQLPAVSDVFGPTYKIKSYQKSLWNSNTGGSPSWGNIKSIDFRITGTSGNTAIFDGFRTNISTLPTVEYSLVTRSSFSTPIIKEAGASLEVEYYIDLS